MSGVKIDDAISGYLKLRGQLEELRDKHKAEEAVLSAKMEKLEAFFLAFLQVSGGDSFASREAGTIFKQEVTSCGVQDWEATLSWIIGSQAWEFLERRVSKSVVMEYAEIHSKLPPGVDVSKKVVVRVRAP